jgi:hypothetical protein
VRLPIVLRLGILGLIGGLFALTWYQPNRAAPVEVTHGDDVVRLALPSHADGGARAETTSSPASERETGTKTLHAADTDGIREAIRADLRELQTCYDEWIKVNPKLDGKVTVAFRLVAAGTGKARIEAARITESQLQHTALEGCVSSVINELSFSDPPNGRLDVTYPLTFSHD